MKILLQMGILGGLFCFLGCANSCKNKIITTTSSGKDTRIKVNDILFTTPTIENTFPKFEDRVDSTDLDILEDDWRQIEFISKDQKASIDMEIDSIDYVLEHKVHNGPSYIGFKDIHVRKLIVEPLSIQWDKILNYLGDTNKKVSGLNIINSHGEVKNGFSLNSKGVEYYGLKDNNNNVIVLCIYGANSDEDLYNSVAKISKFLKSENLFLVHWTHIKVFNEDNIVQLVADFESK